MHNLVEIHGVTEDGEDGAVEVLDSGEDLKMLEAIASRLGRDSLRDHDLSEVRFAVRATMGPGLETPVCPECRKKRKALVGGATDAELDRFGAAMTRYLGGRQEFFCHRDGHRGKAAGVPTA